MILLEQWPCRMAWLMQLLEIVEQNSVLNLAQDHSKTTPIEWKVLREMTAADVYKEYVHGLIYSTDNSSKLLLLDADPQLFEGLLKDEHEPISVKDLAPLPLVWMKPEERYILLRNYAFNLPISVTMKVSRMMDAISAQRGGLYCTKKVLFAQKAPESVYGDMPESGRMCEMM